MKQGLKAAAPGRPEGQGGEGSSGWGTHMYTCGRFMLIYGKKNHNIAKQLFSN